MGECATLPSNFKLNLHTSCAEMGSCIKSQRSFPRKFLRNSNFTSPSLLKASKYKTPSLSTSIVNSPFSGRGPLRCSCSGIMIDVESAAASGWMPLIDQLLLTTSVLLTYTAGVIPSGKSFISSQKNKASDKLLSERSIFSGSIAEKEDQISYQCNWSVVKGKITDSLLAIENGAIIKDSTHEFELDHTKSPLSLYAIARGSRLRLLLSSVEQLEKEVNEISVISETAEREQWLAVFSAAITKACRAAFGSWMEKEFFTENCRPDKELMFHMTEKLKGDEIILGNIRKTGKVELYADLIGYLRYGFFGDCSYYDYNVYPIHGSAILEDLIITLADGIASMYLEVISVDSDISEKISNTGLSLCALSTRALQKLRNEVAMCEWIQRNFGEIVLMYEDRFDLRVLNIEPYKNSTEELKENISWWTRFSLKKSAPVQSSLRYAVVSPFALTLKRTRELRALRGWRYYFSLLLELADIAMPMAKAIVAHVRNAVSFFLVSLIGRSVGLVYTGIRQSLRWK